MSVTIAAEALAGLGSYFDRAQEIAANAARMAINQVAERKAVRAIREMMQAQVAFPPGYLTEDRFGVTRLATTTNLEAAITGRQTPTSLARFAIGQSPQSTRRGGIRVTVKPGSGQTMNRAFLMNLRSGNVGLAIRLKPGERIVHKNSVTAKAMKGGLYLLYGPSVDQVFRSVAVDATPSIADEVASEFLRQFIRLSGER